MIYTAASAVSTNLSSRSSLRCIAASLSAPAASADDIVAAHKTPPLVKPKSRRQERGLVERFAPICRSCCRTRSYTACTLASATPSASTLEISVSDSPNPPATPSHRHSSDHFDNGVAQKACSMAAKTHPSGGGNPGRWGRYGARPPPAPCTASSARAAPLDPPEAPSGSARQSHASISRQTAPTCTHKTTLFSYAPGKEGPSDHQVQRVLSHQEPEPEARCAPTLPSELVNSL